MITVEQLHTITGNTSFADRKKGFLNIIKARGGPLNEPAVLAQVLAQCLHESGGFKYVTEIWGPTKAQLGYEGRADLGNLIAGDGKRFMGRDLIQNTGRNNYRKLSKWAGYDFEKDPDALAKPEWLGVSVVWYFLVARPDLLRYCREGNIEMVTRRVNGGLNGYADRLKWFDKTALTMLGYSAIRNFQYDNGLQVDGISGPATRAKLHRELSEM